MEQVGGDRLLGGEFEQPVMVTMSRMQYEEGTIGFDYFPEEMEGRLRPVDVLEVPIFTNSYKTLSQNALEEMGLFTLADVFASREDVLDRLPGRLRGFAETAISRAVDNFTQRQSLTPHSHLVASLVGREQGPVPPEREADLISDVIRAVDTLQDERKKEILRRHYGLYSWRPVPRARIARSLGVTDQRAKQLEDKGLKILRNNVMVKDIVGRHSSFPTGSLGSLVGETYRATVPDTTLYLDDLNFSPDLEQRLATISFIFKNEDFELSDLLEFSSNVLSGNESQFEELLLKTARAVKLAKRRNEIASDFTPEAMRPNTGRFGAIALMPFSEFGLDDRVVRTLFARGYYQLGDLERLGNPNSTNEPDPVSQTVGKRAQKLGQILDEAFELSDSKTSVD